MIYGSEEWTFKTIDAENLGRFERRILRKIHGAVKIRENEYRKRWNSEIYQIYDDIDIISFVKVSRLRWLGHVYRMEDDNLCKRILEENIIKDLEVDLDTAGGRRCWKILKGWEFVTGGQNPETGTSGEAKVLFRTVEP